MSAISCLPFLWGLCGLLLVPDWTLSRPCLIAGARPERRVDRSLPVFYYFTFVYISLKTNKWGFPGGAVVENLPASAGDTGSSPGLGRFPHAAEQLGP